MEILLLILLILSVPFALGLAIGYFVGLHRGKKHGAAQQAPTQQGPHPSQQPPAGYRPLPGAAVLQPHQAHQRSPAQRASEPSQAAPSGAPYQGIPYPESTQPSGPQPGPPSSLTPPGSGAEPLRAQRTGRAEGPREAKPRNEARAINIALYIGGLVLTAAALAFVALMQDPVLTAASLGLAYGLFASVGFWLAARVSLLKPAGLALFGTSLALLCVAAIPLDAAFIQNAALTWLLVSLVGTLVYGAAGIHLDSRVLGYLAVPFLYSTVVSATSNLQQPMVWTLSIILVLSAAVNTAVVILEDRIPKVISRAFGHLHWLVAPAVLIAGLLQMLSAAENAVLFLAASLYYATAALRPAREILGWVHSLAARVLSVLALLSLLAALEISLPAALSVVSLWLTALYYAISLLPQLTGLRAEQRKQRPQRIRRELTGSLYSVFVFSWAAQAYALMGETVEVTVHLWAAAAVLAAAGAGALCVIKSQPAARSLRVMATVSALSMLYWQPGYSLVWLLLWAVAELKLSLPTARLRWHRGLAVAWLTVLGWTLGRWFGDNDIALQLAVSGLLVASAAVGIVLLRRSVFPLLVEAGCYIAVVAVSVLAGVEIYHLQGWGLASYSAMGIVLLYGMVTLGLRLLEQVPKKGTGADQLKAVDPAGATKSPLRAETLSAALPGLERMRAAGDWGPATFVLRILVFFVALVLSLWGASPSWFDGVELALWPRLIASQLPSVSAVLPAAFLALILLACELVMPKLLPRGLGQRDLRHWIPVHLSAHIIWCALIFVSELALRTDLNLLWLTAVPWAAAVSGFMLINRHVAETEHSALTVRADLLAVRIYMALLSMLLLSAALSSGAPWWGQILVAISAGTTAALALYRLPLTMETPIAVPLVTGISAWVLVSGVLELAELGTGWKYASAAAATNLVIMLVALTPLSAALSSASRSTLRLISAAVLSSGGLYAMLRMGNFLPLDDADSDWMTSAVTMTVTLIGLYAVVYTWARSQLRVSTLQIREPATGNITLVRAGTAVVALMVLLLGNDLWNALQSGSGWTVPRTVSASVLLLSATVWALAEWISSARLMRDGAPAMHRWPPAHLVANVLWLCAVNLVLSVTGLSGGLWWFTAVVWALSAAAFLRASSGNGSRSDQRIGWGYSLAVSLAALTAPMLSAQWWGAVAALTAALILASALRTWGSAMETPVAVPLLVAWGAGQLIGTLLWAGHDADLWVISIPVVGYLSSSGAFLAVGVAVWRRPGRFTKGQRRRMGITAAATAAALSVLPLIFAEQGTAPLLAFSVPAMHTTLVILGLRHPGVRVLAGYLGSLLLPVSVVLSLWVRVDPGLTTVSLMLLSMVTLLLVSEWLLLSPQTSAERVWILMHYLSAGLISLVLAGLGLAQGAGVLVQTGPLAAGALMLLAGLLRGRRSGLYIGAGLIVVSVLWALRSMMVLLLVVLGALIIGAAVWRLVVVQRKQKNNDDDVAPVAPASQVSPSQVENRRE